MSSTIRTFGIPDEPPDYHANTGFSVISITPWRRRRAGDDKDKGISVRPCLSKYVVIAGV
jgi:hypothetical protein